MMIIIISYTVYKYIILNNISIEYIIIILIIIIIIIIIIIFEIP